MIKTVWQKIMNITKTKAALKSINKYDHTFSLDDIEKIQTDCAISVETKGKQF